MPVYLRSYGEEALQKRNVAMFYLSAHAGLRAAEIAQITWYMVMDSQGLIDSTLNLEDYVAKKKHGRKIPMTNQLRKALDDLRLQDYPNPKMPIIKSKRGSNLTPKAVSRWFSEMYKSMGYLGCTSHSGRRTFITMTAKITTQTGGSIRDVQQLAGHHNLNTTQRYIEGSDEAKLSIISRLSDIQSPAST